MSLIGVLVTYRRADQLAITLRRLSEQSVTFARVFVVDNDPAQSALASCSEFDYLPMGDNVGPAGALAAGTRAALRVASNEDWIVFLDDDDPPASSTELADLLAFATSQGADVGAVGKAGARYDHRRGRPSRLRDEDLEGVVDVDWIGGGQFPLYRPEALASAIPDASLFFGFDDLELGLRLRKQGWRLTVEGDAWARRRAQMGRRDLTPKNLRAVARTSDWRRYYTARNLVLISRANCGWRGVAWNISHQVARSIADLRHGRGAAAMTVRGTRDGVMGRRGRTVHPGY